ncbi:hypothetical protein IFM89_022499 [Coptis chinensis]|uniref:Uncharacterized protein n=1 Tax=Coptis chinensis TaxID=261450 RepID=A0A835IF36_9MAGN|nr:hypothetical protein IFM89_022499 [Coptis chinensis]
MATSRRFDWTKNWELQDVGDKEWLWDNIKDKWELDETRKEPTLALIFGDEFRNKKSKWKRNFYTRYATYEERISHRSEQLSQQEWVQLMEFWETPEHQAISKRNRANRAKQIAKHAAGRISFPQFEEIMEEERRLEIEKIKRQAQEKDEQRRHEIDEMKRQLDARDADMETQLMQKVANFAQMVSRREPTSDGSNSVLTSSNLSSCNSSYSFLEMAATYGTISMLFCFSISVSDSCTPSSSTGMSTANLFEACTSE